MKEYLDNISKKWDRVIEKAGLSGFALKIIASVVMVIDHAAFAVLLPYINVAVTRVSPERFMEVFDRLELTYRVMRNIGRIAFPIYCFLLVEGFLHTKNFKKYLITMLGFGIISEPFFDLALYKEIWHTEDQNVFFTLAAGLLCIRLLDVIISGKAPYFNKLTPFIRYILSAVVIGGFSVIAWYLKTDYDYKGVLVIALMFLLRKYRLIKLVISEIPFNYEPWAFCSIIPLMFYNNKRGKISGKIGKYFFYAFYPLHLFVLYLISYFMGCR